jgi:hypothetical protein
VALALSTQPDVMRGMVRLAASGVPNGDIVVTRRYGSAAPVSIRGGLIPGLITGGFVLSDPEPNFGTDLVYRVVDTVANRYLQTNRVLNPRFAIGLGNWSLPTTRRTVAQETTLPLAPPRDSTTSVRVGPGSATTGSLPSRRLARTSPVGFTTGSWYVSGQVRYDSPNIWLWQDAKDAGTWQTVKNKGTWADVKATNSPLAGQAFATLWAAVLGPTTTSIEQRRNRIPNPVPTATTGYTSNAGTGGTATNSYVATGGPTGSGFFRATWTTANTTAAGTSPGASVRADGRPTQSTLSIPVTPGQAYSASLWSRSSIAQRLGVQIWFFDANGTQTFSGNYSPQVVTANTWTQFTAQNVVAPAGSAYVVVGISTASGTGVVPFPVGATLDQALTILEAATTVGTYFDGTTAAEDGGSLVYSWIGTANASASIQNLVDYPSIVAPFQILGVQTEANSMWATFQARIDIPAGAPANCQLAFYQGTATREYAVTWWLSTMMVSLNSEVTAESPVYFDGSTPVGELGDLGSMLAPGLDWKALTGDASVAWSGTPNASTSVLTGPSQIFSESSTSIGTPTTSQLPRVKIPVFLSDPVAPQLAQWFELLEIGDLSYAARQDLFDVLGRGAQIAVSQLRAWPSGELRVLTYTPEAAEIAERLFGTGRILYWRNPDPRYPENGWYIAVGDLASGRVGATVAWSPERIWRIPFVKVERPEGLISAATSVSWSTVKTSYTWQQLRDQRTDWLDVALTEPGA